MDFSWLATVFLYSLVGLLALASVLVKPRWVPILLVLLMPLGNFDFDWHVGFSLSKIVLIVFLLSLPAQHAVTPDLGSRLRLPASLWVFLVCTLLPTVVSFGLGEVTSSQGFEALRGPQLRPIVQLLSLGIRIAGLLVVLGWVTDRGSAITVYKAILLVSTLIAAYGLYQFVGYYAGWPIMGITRPQAELSGGHALFSIGGISIFRLGSFVGEPKQAAKFLLPSILLIISAKTLSIVPLRSWLTSYPVLALHCLAFVLTFATSSFFGLALSIPGLTLLWMCYRGQLSLGRLTAAVVIATLGIAVLVRIGGGREAAKRVFEARFIDRVGEIGSPERATIEFLKDHPGYLATGIGLGNSSFYLRPHFDPAYYRPLTVGQNSSYLQVLSEAGMPALVSFLVFLGGWLIRGFRLTLHSEAGEYQALVAATTGICLTLAAINAFSSTESSGQIWVAWGLLIALCRMGRPYPPVFSTSVGRYSSWARQRLLPPGSPGVPEHQTGGAYRGSRSRIV